MCLFFPLLTFTFQTEDKYYNSQYAAVQDLYGYYHADESAFQLVDTVKTTQRQLFRARKWQVRTTFVHTHTHTRGELRCKFVTIRIVQTPRYNCVLDLAVYVGARRSVFLWLPLFLYWDCTMVLHKREP